MGDLKREGRRSRAVAISGGSLALFGSGSVLTSGGALIAQVTGHVGSATLLGIYGSAALIAVVGAITTIVKIVAERPSDIRKASALAKIAKKRAGQDGGTILLLDRALDREGATCQVLEVLSMSSKPGEQCGSPEDAESLTKPDEISQNVLSIHTPGKEGRASHPPDLTRHAWSVVPIDGQGPLQCLLVRDRRRK